MAPEPPGSPRRETLFRQDAATGVTFRIPALLYLPRAATFLAFAEKRASARDEDAEHLVLRRGRRRGRAVQWGPLEELRQLRLPGHRAMNPCPVYEAAAGTVFLLCICVRGRVSERRQLRAGRSAARLCVAASADGGRSWAPLRDLTAQAVGPDLRRWATFAVGPGHGVQLRAGRLAAPAYAYYVHRRLCGRPLPCCTRPHALVVYSDDQGRSWSKGALVQGVGTGECQVAEVAAGDGGSVLYCSARPRRLRCRAVALSTDRGLRFGRSVRCEELCEPPRGCQGSVVSFTPEDEDDDGDDDTEGDDTNGAIAGDAISNEAVTNNVITSNTKANNVINNTKDNDVIANQVITNNVVTNNVIANNVITNDIITSDVIASDAIANNAKANDEVNNVKPNDAIANDAVAKSVEANNVKGNAANATVADSAHTNASKANDAKASEDNVNTAKTNTAKANNAKVNDDNADDAKTNDAKINDAKANNAKVNDDKANNANPNDAKADDPKANANAASWLLFSHPTDRHRRRDLGIYVNPSPLSGSSWWPPWLLYEGPCGYSDLAVCPGGLFGCLFECGPVSGCEEIAFCLFSQRQLLGACGQRGTR